MFTCQLYLNKAREKKRIKGGVLSETWVCVGVIKGPVYQIYSSLENNDQKSKVSKMLPTLLTCGCGMCARCVWS